MCMLTVCQSEKKVSFDILEHFEFKFQISVKYLQKILPKNYEFLLS